MSEHEALHTTLNRGSTTTTNYVAMRIKGSERSPSSHPYSPPLDRPTTLERVVNRKHSQTTTRGATRNYCRTTLPKDESSANVRDNIAKDDDDAPVSKNYEAVRGW